MNCTRLLIATHYMKNCKNTEIYINAMCTVGTSLIFATEILILASDQFIYWKSNSKMKTKETSKIYT